MTWERLKTSSTLFKQTMVRIFPAKFPRLSVPLELNHIFETELIRTFCKRVKFETNLSGSFQVFVGRGGAVFVKRFLLLNLLSEQFDEATIKSILEAVVALLKIDVPESKAKVLMLIAEIAKSGNGGIINIFIIVWNELVKQIS